MRPLKVSTWGVQVDTLSPQAQNQDQLRRSTGAVCTHLCRPLRSFRPGGGARVYFGARPEPNRMPAGRIRGGARRTDGVGLLEEVFRLRAAIEPLT